MSYVVSIANENGRQKVPPKSTWYTPLMELVGPQTFETREKADEFADIVKAEFAEIGLEKSGMQAMYDSVQVEEYQPEEEEVAA